MTLNLRRFALVVVCISVFMPQLSSAIDVGAMGSYWTLEDSDNGGTWGVGGKVSIPLFTEYLKPQIRAYWFPDVDDKFDGKVDIIPVDIGPVISFNPDGEINPYITGGTGYVFISGEEEDIDDDYGYYAGGGVELKALGPVEFFAEVLYRFLELDANDRWSDEDEVEMNGLTVNVGLQLDF
jgi:hypothetical protein